VEWRSVDCFGGAMHIIVSSSVVTVNMIEARRGVLSSERRRPVAVQ